MNEVIYNGGSTDPSELVVGNIYEVTKKIKKEEQTYYTLRGIKGKFNSLCFNEVCNTPTHFAFSYQIPIVGKSCICNKVVFDDNDSTVKIVGWHTSPVKYVQEVGKNTYRIVTYSSIYLVTVL